MSLYLPAIDFVNRRYIGFRFRLADRIPSNLGGIGPLVAITYATTNVSHGWVRAYLFLFPPNSERPPHARQE